METLPRYRSTGERIIAAFIDGIVFIPISIIDHLVFNGNNPSFIVAVWAFISQFSFVAYSIILHAKFGQTIGKKVLKIQVQNSAENRIPTLKESFLRDSVAVFFVSAGFIIFLLRLFSTSFDPSSLPPSLWSLLLWFPFAWVVTELVTMFSNKRRRALHDFIGGTVVVRPGRDLSRWQKPSLSAPE